MQWVGSSKASLEEGSMRCDVNVSVRRKGQEAFGTRCELKNLNRIRILSMAIDAEIRRQIGILENGGEIVVETRRYDEEKDITYRLRSKEDAPDYRYMPEPDLPPLVLSQVYLRLLLFIVTNTLFWVFRNILIILQVVYLNYPINALKG